MIHTSNGHGVFIFSTKKDLTSAINVLEHSGFLTANDSSYDIVDHGEVVEENIIDTESLIIKIPDWSYSGLGNTIELLSQRASKGYLSFFNIAKEFSISTWSPSFGYTSESRPDKILEYAGIDSSDCDFHMLIDLLTLPAQQFEHIYQTDYYAKLIAFGEKVQRGSLPLS